MNENFEFDTTDSAETAVDVDSGATEHAPPPSHLTDDATPEGWEVVEAPPLPDDGFGDLAPPPSPEGSGGSLPGDPTGLPFELPPEDPAIGASFDDSTDQSLTASPPPIDLGGVDLAPPGDGTGVQGDQPPLPPGIGDAGERQSPVPPMNGGEDTGDRDTLVPPHIELSGIDLATPPGGGPTTGDLGDQPPLPPGIGNAGEGQSPIPPMGGGDDGDALAARPIELDVDFGTVVDVGDQGDGQSPVPEMGGTPPDVLIDGGETDGTEPEDETDSGDGAGSGDGTAPLTEVAGGAEEEKEGSPSEGATETVTGGDEATTDLTPVTMVPATLGGLLAAGVVSPEHMDAFLADLADVADGDGNVSLTGLVDTLAAHKAEVTSAGDKSLEEVCKHAGRVDVLGEVAPGRMERLKIQGFDPDGGVNLQSRSGEEFRVPATALSTPWSEQGKPVVTVPNAEDVGVPTAATGATEEDGGMSGAGKATLAGALLLPIVAGGGILARRLRR